MTNYYLLILGYLLLFVSILFFFYRLRRVHLSDEDYEFWLKIEKKLELVQLKVFKISQLFKKEVFYLFNSLKEKVLRRIKIEALKIESWASKKIERMKDKQDSQNSF